MAGMNYLMAAFAGAVVGFICSIPVGSINVAIMEAGVHHGRNRALLVGLGALLMEMAYCSVAFGGFARLFDDHLVRASMELISFVALVYFGVQYLRAKSLPPQSARARQLENRLHPHTAFSIGLVRVLVNPNVLLFWIIVAAALMANGLVKNDLSCKLACMIGIVIGTGGWFAMLGLGSAGARERFSGKALVKMSHYSGVLLLVIALGIGFRLIRLLVAGAEQTMP